MNDFSGAPLSPSENMKNKAADCVVFIVVMILVALSCARAKEEEPEFLYTFLQGTYEVVGRWPDSLQTYTGTMILSRNTDCFKVLRTISGEEIEAVGKIETATVDKIKVLRIRFPRGGEQYEATYLIGSDLDNYGRLTGYVYSKERPTEQPGLEALFYDRRTEQDQAVEN